MEWALLAVAVCTEVAAVLSLRVAVHGKRMLYGAVIGLYLVSFCALSLTLAAGMPLGVAYGVWAAAGIALTAALSRVLFNEPLTLLMVLGIVLIVGGVTAVEIGR